MSDFPALGEGGRYEAGVDTAVSAGPILTGAAGAHTKGAYTQLIASTAFDAEGIWVILGRGVSVTSYLVDIAIGGAGAEQVIIPNLAFYSPVNDSGNRHIFIPISIPAGTRIAGRCQTAAGGSQQLRCGVLLQAHGFVPSNPLGRVKDYGISTATSTGTTIDPGVTVNTKGAWVQMVASTDNDIEMLLLAVGYRLQAVGAPGPQWLVDIGVGGIGAEQVIISNLWLGVAGTWDDFLQQMLGPFPVHIPAGTRLVIRAQCNTATSPDRTFAAGLYGLD